MGTAGTEIKITLPYPPSVNHLYLNSKKGRILSDDGKRFKFAAGLSAKQQMKKQKAELLRGELSITFSVFRPIRRGDLDNRIKISQDALKGVCFDDDEQIAELHAYRFEDKQNPRIEIKITLRT